LAIGLKNTVRFYIRRWGRKYLPENVISALRFPLKYVRSKKREVVRRERPPLSIEGLRANLRDAGICAGDIVMVHSSLSRIGNVEGGPAIVVQSIIDVITPDGTVIMPCYNSAEALLKEYRFGRQADLRVMPSAVGKITDTFRIWPGVLRSSHPFSSACAWGKQANYIVSGHAEKPGVCHEESPVGRLVRLKGKAIGIGIPISQGLGVAHHLEDTWDGFPFEVHAPEFTIAYIDSDGQKVERKIWRFDPFVARTRIDQPEGAWICEKLTDHLLRHGLLKRFRYGDADSWIMEAEPLFQELKRLAGKGVTMYLTESRLTDQNRDIENW